MLLLNHQVNPGTALHDRKRSIEVDQPSSVAAQLLLNSLNLQPSGKTDKKISVVELENE